MPKPTPPDYDKIELEMWRSNADSVQKDISEDRAPYLTKKVETYVWRFIFGFQMGNRRVRLLRDS